MRRQEVIALPEKGGRIELRSRIGNDLIAFAHVMRRAEANERELLIREFNVISAQRGKGYGTLLMDQIKKILTKEKRRGVLSVHASNQRAQDFYVSQGWEFDDVEEDKMLHPGQKPDHLQRRMVYEDTGRTLNGLN
jgi:GNAT superfamily N-acetyltransferase